MLPGTLLNSRLDRLVRPDISILRRTWSSFQVCGYTGLALAILLAMSLVIYQHLSPFVMLFIIVAAVLTFFAQAMITKIVLGEEDLVYYRHEIAVMAVAALLLWLLRQPILPYLDATLLGVGIFLACGRIGCLMVGCCHGRPHSWGVCYRQEHAASGFESCYVGVRLFPSQLIESLWVLCIVIVGIILVLTGHWPGTALAWYVIAYDVGRFYGEFMRGDAERPYLWEFSEAQLVSVVLMCVVVWAEIANILPFQLWHVLATFCIICTLLGVVIKRRLHKIPAHRLLHPYHVREIAKLLQRITNDLPTGIRVESTSLGIQLSFSQIKSEAGILYHYTLSCQRGDMTEEMARGLAKLIVQLKHPLHSNELIRGNQRVFHLLVDPSRTIIKQIDHPVRYATSLDGAK
jgi:prolipoprotein diacylglyceryltransferase